MDMLAMWMAGLMTERAALARRDYGRAAQGLCRLGAAVLTIAIGVVALSAMAAGG